MLQSKKAPRLLHVNLSLFKHYERVVSVLKLSYFTGGIKIGGIPLDIYHPSDRVYKFIAHIEAYLNFSNLIPHTYSLSARSVTLFVVECIIFNVEEGKQSN